MLFRIVGVDLEMMANSRNQILMRSDDSKRRPSLRARGFAALGAALIMAAAGGSASAAPTETVLHAFTNGSDGANPYAGLIADSKGNLYGTTYQVGASNNGVVFELTPPAVAGGASPFAGLIADSKGNLYGTTGGGDASNNGVVFELSPLPPPAGPGPRRCCTPSRPAATGPFPLRA